MSHLKITSLFSGLMILFFASCKKENSLITDSTTSASVSSSSVIAVAAGISSSTQDSVYVVGACDRGANRDSIGFADLSSAITSYLSATYSGYTFSKAFKIVDNTNAVTGYVVIIQYNGNPVGLKFDASGAFVKVLEQREGRDLDGRGWHDGGRFNCRDGIHRDTVALSSLPAGVLTYIATNYPQDTVSAAFKKLDGSFVVISKDNGVFATTFTATGTFISRVQLPAPPCRVTSIEQSALPANVQSYLTATYPNYVFEKAFILNNNNTLQGYLVIIDANATKYAVEFDASGNFIKAKTIH